MTEHDIAPHRSPDDPLPVLVLTGFLGAGKTTLLNYLLSGLSGVRVAALVNDFGTVEVDALNIASRVDSTISLSGGCMCCEIDVSEVDGALADLARPEADIDIVVIEASGLAEPDVLAAMIRRQPRTTVSYAGLVNVIDAVHFNESARQHPQLYTHLAISDLLVVTKRDAVTPTQLDALITGLRERAPRVPITRADFGRLDIRLFFGPIAHEASPRKTAWLARSEGTGHEPEGHGPEGHGHMHDAYSTCVAVPTGPLHPRRFMACVRAMPRGVFRAKGTLVLADEDGPWSYHMNVVGEMLDLRAEGPCDAGDSTEVVLIGVGLDPAAADFLDAAVLRAGESVVAEDRFALEPYLVAPADASDASGWLYEEETFAPLVATARMLVDPEDPDSQDPTQTP